jgi:threonyl-tRNA synthetase
MKYPRMLVVGDKEVEGGDLTVRIRGQQDQVAMSKKDFIANATEENDKRLA